MSFSVRRAQFGSRLSPLGMAQPRLILLEVDGYARTTRIVSGSEAHVQPFKRSGFVIDSKALFATYVADRRSAVLGISRLNVWNRRGGAVGWPQQSGRTRPAPAPRTTGKPTFDAKEADARRPHFRRQYGNCNFVQRSPLLSELGERRIHWSPQDGDEALEPVIQLPIRKITAESDTAPINNTTMAIALRGANKPKPGARAPTSKHSPATSSQTIMVAAKIVPRASAAMWSPPASIIDKISDTAMTGTARATTNGAHRSPAQPLGLPGKGSTSKVQIVEFRSISLGHGSDAASTSSHQLERGNEVCCCDRLSYPNPPVQHW